MAVLVNPAPPCVVFEDDHLLLVRKPAGWNTHAPSPWSGEGLYEWLRDREPRWKSLAIVHRLDKETSGLLVLALSPEACRSLTAQFTSRTVAKRYILQSQRPPPKPDPNVRTALVRTGDHYTPRPAHAGAEIAETRFHWISTSAGVHRIEAVPLTGKTHQIRAHAAHAGFPILGDTLYGGAAAQRLHLHAASLAFQHPVSGQRLVFEDPPDFEADPGLALRAACIHPDETNGYRLIHGAADGWPGTYVDRLSDALLLHCAQKPDGGVRERARRLMHSLNATALFHKAWRPDVRGRANAELSPQQIEGASATPSLVILENGVRFAIRFDEGYSIGLFLDQRDNRRRLLHGHIAAGFPTKEHELQGSHVLNTFAYTCGFSVCAARAGASVTSLDLSPKYLEWGRENFALNQLPLDGHDFIYGDVFEWSRRLARKGRRFRVVILDPPTFSQSKSRGVFRAAKDYGALLAAVLPLLEPNGIVLASTNAGDLKPEDFLAQLDQAITSAGRRCECRHYAPQPPDHPVHRAEPAHLKTVWLRIR